MQKEEWKPVEGYEGLYEISSLGRVKSLWFGKEKILKPMKTKYGYLRVALFRDGKGKFLLIHRLVAEAFIPNPKRLPEINHIDEDKTNNAKSNIEWCSRRYNINYGTHNEKVAAALSKPVEASRFSDFREIELRFVSTMEAERNGFKHGAVSYCCNGRFCSKGNFYKGLYWRFAV